jgi:hypothetical protein
VGILCVALALGCSKAPDSRQPDEEAAVRAQFTALQAGVQDGDADKLWSLLDSRSQADAERVAKAVRASYAEATPAEQAEMDNAIALTGPH